jgi:hypothetical protein
MAGRSEVNVGYPMTLSSLVGRDIRTGTHACFERVVVELQDGDPPGGTFPGYRVGYATGPIEQSPSGLPVTIRGDAVLIVAFGAWMQTMEGAGYQGPWQIVPTNVTHVLELRLLENFEGMTMWAVGLDEERDFTVTTMDSPPRLVVDIQTAS